jgi:integral membrane protein
MLNHFRIISLIEGLSFLVLLFVAMPLKYHWGHPEAVSMVGMTHGLLFIAYVVLAAMVGPRQGWSDRFVFGVILAGMLPFGCFFLEQRLKKEALEAAVQNG